MVHMGLMCVRGLVHVLMSFLYTRVEVHAFGLQFFDPQASV